MVQLRDPAASDDELLRRGRALPLGCATSTARCSGSTTGPTSRSRAGADGVHVGQDDMPVDEAAPRASCSSACPPTRPSSSRPGLRSGADQLSVGPVWETPTKPGRPAAGLEYVRHAAAPAPSVPWFAIGGIDASQRRRRSSRRVRRGSWWCVRSATPPTRAPRPPRCGRRSIGGPLAQRSSRKRRKQRQRAQARVAEAARRATGWRAATRAGARRTRRRGRR